MKMIPNSISKDFNTVEGRKRIIELYGDSEFPYFGVNEDNERVQLSVSRDGIVLRTNQSNGWQRVNYYDKDGNNEGETFDGRWDE